LDQDRVRVTGNEQRIDHGDYDAIEGEFNEVLEASLDPRGPDVLYDVVSRLVPTAGWRAIDAGCGRGDQALELARRFSCSVVAIDPARRFEVPGDPNRPEAGAVWFCRGVAEHLPVRATGRTSSCTARCSISSRI
jgi:ubiquinone/menaquinone biosynthesis C-methylase UbiE